MNAYTGIRRLLLLGARAEDILGRRRMFKCRPGYQRWPPWRLAQRRQRVVAIPRARHSGPARQFWRRPAGAARRTLPKAERKSCAGALRGGGNGVELPPWGWSAAVCWRIVVPGAWAFHQPRRIRTRADDRRAPCIPETARRHGQSDVLGGGPARSPRHDLAPVTLIVRSAEQGWSDARDAWRR